MKKLFLLYLSLLGTSTGLFAQNFFESNLGGDIVFVQDLASWQAQFVPTTAPAIPLGSPDFTTFDDVYIINVGDSIVIGGPTATPPSNNSVIFGSNQRLMVEGALGFRQGNNALVFGTNGYIDIPMDGLVGFAKGPGVLDYKGNASNNIVMSGTSYRGPFLAEGPDFSNTSSGFSSSTFWTGEVSTDWFDAGNWSNGVPNPQPANPPSTLTPTLRNAIIPDEYPDETTGDLVAVPMFPVLVSGNNPELKRLTTFEGSSLVISNEASVTIDACLGNFGEIIVLSGGALVQTENSPIVCFDGNFVIEIDLPGVNPWFIGSPVNTSQPHSVSIPNGGLSGSFVDNGDCAGSDLNLNWIGMMQLEENASLVDGECSHNLWSYTNTDLTVARGYAAYAPAGHTLVFEGIINNNEVSYNGLGRQTGTVTTPSGFVETRGWHLVSNPYPSPITITETQLTAMGFDAQVHRWNQGSWVSDFPGAPVTIAVGQGFQVRTSTVGGTANFELNNNFRTTDPAIFYKNLESIGSNLKITLNNDTYTDETYIYFREDATDAFDPLYDANRLTGLAEIPLLFTLSSDNQRLSFNAIQNLEADVQKEVSLGLYEGVGGDFELTFSELATLETEYLNVSVVLEDKKRNEFIQISENTSYVFTFEEGDDRNRFVVHFFPTVKSIEEEEELEEVLSIDDVTKNQISLFPNPTNGDVKVILNENHEFNILKVTNVTGKVINDISLHNSQKIVNLNLDDLTAGLYFITLKGNSSQVVKKIIKN